MFLALTLSFKDIKTKANLYHLDLKTPAFPYYVRQECYMGMQRRLSEKYQTSLTHVGPSILSSPSN